MAATNAIKTSWIGLGSYFNFLKAASILINKHNRSDVTVRYDGEGVMSQLVKIVKMVEGMSRVQLRCFIGYPPPMLWRDA